MDKYQTISVSDQLDYAGYVEKLGLEREAVDAREQPRTDQMSFIMLHMAFGMVTEAAEIADILKKHMAYGRDLDVTKLKDELGDLYFYLMGFLLEIESCPLEIQKMNVAKLTTRYPNGYSHEAANNRNLNAENVAIVDCKHGE